MKQSIRTTKNTVIACAAMFFAGMASALSMPLVAVAADDAGAKPGDQFMESLLATVSNWNDYSCVAELHSYKTGKDVLSSCRFFYKKKDQVRIEVTGGGYRDGSVIVRRADSSVRAHGGGLLGAMTMNLDPDSRMLIMANGTNVTKSDFPTVIGDWKQLLHKSYTAKMQLKAGEPVDPSNKVYVVEITDPNQQLARKLWIAGDQRTPLRFDFYADGKLLTTCYFKNLKPNAGLGDDLFKL